ncbi:nitrogenase [Hydrococcus rivularis NIES-593]|uniref:Nitrogenase n=1 Tax=Hydrococcus rivularis NIES-593 TaxID=1921803 RepID=A0A1U7H864_9CYAN|nr:Mo-dependent nitrogenase C-terminal domain-containing protein [Hydrococcus rivularis]OKH19121.1 nitrogenase [Hydrococcus rivularis NIES-593]
MKNSTSHNFNFNIEPLHQVRQWLESIEINSDRLARVLCRLIPARCPFEREIKLFNRTILYIPPLCKLNPFYEQLVELRFKALCYLADECHEDVTIYC